MAKHRHYPNPRTNGNTGTYVKDDGIDPNLVAILIMGGITVACVGAAYLYGKACGENTTFRQLCIESGLIDDDNNED